MIRGIDDFKAKVNYWLDEVLSVGCTCKKVNYWLNEVLSVGCTCKDDEDEIKQLQRIVELINCAVIFELDGNREFLSEISLKEIIDILSDDGKIKKLSEVDFDE